MLNAVACAQYKSISCGRSLYGLRELPYDERLSTLNLHSLELRRLHFDLVWCYKILFGLVHINSDTFFKLNVTSTRGHPYKLFKHRSLLPQCTFVFLQ